MVRYYLTRLAEKQPEDRQPYLDDVVAKRFRADVLEQWNLQHPEEPLI